MRISPDEIVFWEYGFINLNLTIVMTWAIMILLVIGAWLITRNLKTSIDNRSRWQNLLEIIVLLINDQIKEIGLKNPKKYKGYISTLFLFIAVYSIFSIIPCFEPPAASLSTNGAFA